MLCDCGNKQPEFYLTKAGMSPHGHGQEEHSCSPTIICQIRKLQEQPLQAFLLFPKARQWTNKVSHGISTMFLMGGTVSTSCQIYCEHTIDLVRWQGKLQYTEFCCYWLTLLRRMSGGGSSFPLLQEGCWK